MFQADADGVIVNVGPFVRSPYNYDMDLASDQSGLMCTDDSLAVQSSRDEVDINTIVRNFGLTGQLPENLRVPMSGDYTGVNDYHSALNAVLEADASFMELPAEIRYRFGNDPQKLLDFVSDKANLDEARKLGIAVPAPVEVPPMRVRVMPEPPAGDSST